jgi:hypothetical protein
MFDPEKITDETYDQRVYEIAKDLADSLELKDFTVTNLDRLSQIITDAAGDRVAREFIYQANLKLREENRQLKRDVGRLYDELTWLKVTKAI